MSVHSLNHYLCEQSVQEEPDTNTKSQISIFDVPGLYGHPFYLVCPNVLSLIGEFLSEDGCGSPDHIYRVRQKNLTVFKMK